MLVTASTVKNVCLDSRFPFDADAGAGRSNLTQIVTSQSFVGLYHTISEVNAQLSVPEKLWATWYAWWRNDTLATGSTAAGCSFANRAARHYELRSA